MNRTLKCSAAVLVLAIAMPAAADEIICKTIFQNRTIDGDILVPRGASCILANTYVKGNVRLADRAQLVARDKTFVEGSVQTDGANRVRIRNSEVNGNIQLTGIDYSQESLVVNTRVGGTIDWEDNDAGMLIRYNKVNGDIKVNQNNRRARIYDNKVGGNLQCQANEPAPVGARNIVDGNKENQCRRF